MEVFTNELTREFLQPTKEVMDGYYPFQSKTRKYTMAFLEEATIIERSYRLKMNRNLRIFIFQYIMNVILEWMFSSTPTIIQIVWKIYEEAEYVQILDEKVEQLKAVNQTLLEDIDKKCQKSFKILMSKWMKQNIKP